MASRNSSLVTTSIHELFFSWIGYLLHFAIWPHKWLHQHKWGVGARWKVKLLLSCKLEVFFRLTY